MLIHSPHTCFCRVLLHSTYGNVIVAKLYRKWNESLMNPLNTVLKKRESNEQVQHKINLDQPLAHTFCLYSYGRKCLTQLTFNTDILHATKSSTCQANYFSFLFCQQTKLFFTIPIHSFPLVSNWCVDSTPWNCFSEHSNLEHVQTGTRCILWGRK